MSNNYDMAYFSRDQSTATKEELSKPYTYDPSQLGYRPRYPEEEAQRAAIRDGVVDLIAEARRRQDGAVEAKAS